MKSIDAYRDIAKRTRILLISLSKDQVDNTSIVNAVSVVNIVVFIVVFVVVVKIVVVKNKILKIDDVRKNPADDWNRTTDLWCRRRLLFPLRHNHGPT